ncbi:MAG TPA: hypothetical protein PLE09_02465 [Caldisericia bacterium]|jgi:hypothetical protein|nr:hypothetical protein [Caldisericia bacterium]HXK51403.1 hypothetical protein [Caldisericia bacterium]
MNIHRDDFLKWFLVLIFLFVVPFSARRVVIEDGITKTCYLTYYRRLPSFYYNSCNLRDSVYQTPPNHVLYDGYIWNIHASND